MPDELLHIKARRLSEADDNNMQKIAAKLFVFI